MQQSTFTYTNTNTNTPIAGCVWNDKQKSSNSLIFLQHATGFCKEVWSETAQALLDKGVSCSIVSCDARNHGDSQHGFSSVMWADIAEDHKIYLEKAAVNKSVVGIGHSMGGATLAIAEIRYPNTFSCLVLIEPIIMPPPYKRTENHPLALATQNRKDTFSTKESIYQNYTKPPFANFTKGSLDAYIGGAFREVTTKDGEKEWKLKCTPAEESEFYRMGGLQQTYDHLSQIKIPVLVIVGENSNIPVSFFEAIVKGIGKNAKLHIVPQAGHLLVMEKPDEIASIALKFARDSGFLLPSNKL